MIITFEEKENKKYEIQSDEVDKIFEDIKLTIADIYDKYNYSDKASVIAVLASKCITDQMSQMLSDKFGADRIIKLTDAEKFI